MYNHRGDQQDFSLSFLTLLLARSTSCCFSLASVWSCCSCARRSCSSCLRKASSQTFNLSTAELSVLKKEKVVWLQKKKVTAKTSAGSLVRVMFKRAPKVIPDCFGFVCSSLCDWSKKKLALPSQPIRSTNQTKIDHFSVTRISRLPVLFFPLLIDWCCYFRLVYPHLILCALSFLEFLSTNNCNNNTNKAFVSP